MKLFIADENSGPSFSVSQFGKFIENGGGFYLKSDDGTLSMLQTWTDSNRAKTLRKLKRIVAAFNKEQPNAK
jgi:hypothetical protein